ncbi:plasmid pRiA4b ORF-3 family protein [Bacillus carboniphilus]|uniref:Plasmid pRiA4b ORF-3 family protein n=1 Tax=Bacillus carboniphilus TaxID=86663 RepID=A0ABY9JQ69_9BACI|nr:plasmid pRiA4b ORF-3 family protein [Bacillus carboniphilus]WLR41542.1 plasmid pRiA4b ORF-3 family protein [Bacillus carboniphilus]
MILQLKVTLKYMKPPVWRRIQMDENMTFYDLHKILQIAFNWDDYHLHGFEIKKTNGEILRRKVLVEPDNPDDFMAKLMGASFDEQEEKIGKWLVEEKDKCIYTYDFGDDWEHEIVVEKKLPAQINTSYPHCVKAMRVAPEEDSRGDFMNIEEVATKELTAQINQQLARLHNTNKETKAK